MPKPLKPQVRQAIIDFDPHAPNAVSITEFCAELNISRKTYYTIKNRFQHEGFHALHPHPSTPNTLPTRYTQTTIDTITRIREQLDQQGWDNGPISIWYTMLDDPDIAEPIPSRSTIARILSELNLVDSNPRKRPRASIIRFARSAAMQLWQLDSFTYQLANNAGTVTIYQIIDDATRYDVGTMAMTDPENGQDALVCLRQAFDTYGVPQQLLSDNSRAFNQARLGSVTLLHRNLATLGCEAITGRTYHPQTQGKNERSHLTVQRFLNAHRPISVDQVNELLNTVYRPHYNEKRRHQALKGMTPQQAWDSIEHQPSDCTPIRLDEQALRSRAVDATSSQDDDKWRDPQLLQIAPTARPMLKVQDYYLAIPKRMCGIDYFVLHTEQEYALFNSVDGELELEVPLPIEVVGGRRKTRVPLWKVVGLWLRNPPAWFTARRQRWWAAHGLD